MAENDCQGEDPVMMLVERLKTQICIAKGAIEVEMNEDGETDVFEHSSEGLVEVLEQASAEILSLSQEGPAAGGAGAFRDTCRLL